VAKWVSVGLFIQSIVIFVQGTSSVRTVSFETLHTGCKVVKMSPIFVVLAYVSCFVKWKSWLILVGLTSAIQIVSQLLIWSLTLYKYVDLNRRSEWQTIHLLSLVVRDGFWVFAPFSSKCSVKHQGRRPDLIFCSTPRGGYCGGSATGVYHACRSAHSCPSISVGFQLFIAYISQIIDRQ